jgi:hypothetical protein
VYVTLRMQEGPCSGMRQDPIAVGVVAGMGLLSGSEAFPMNHGMVRIVDYLQKTLIAEHLR